MPQLREDAAASFMNRARNLTPAIHLFCSPNPGHIRIANGILRNRHPLGDDQAGGGTLRIVLSHQRVGHRTGRPHAGEWGHNNAVRHLEVADV
jgi:hypothetical protein